MLQSGITILSFILGICVGSFLLVVVTRLAENKSFLSGRSACDACGHTLSPFDLVPLFSYILLKGHCRYCHSVLSPFYWIVELVTGFIFALTSLSLMPLLPSVLFFEMLIGMWFVIGGLEVIFFSDLWYGYIPDGATILIGIIGILHAWQFHALFSSLFAGIGAGLFFLLLLVGTKGRGMGWGDVKYVVAMGFLLGIGSTLVGLYIAFITGALVALALVIFHKMKLRGSTIPFGPFLVFGTLAALTYGEVLWKWYLHFI